MAWRFPVNSRNAALDAIYDRVDNGSGPGKLEIRTGSQPAAGAAATGTLLVTITLEDPAFAPAASGSKDIVDPDPVNAVASGTAGWFRMMDSDNNIVADGACGTSSSELILPTTTITAGVAVDISGGTVTFPSG